MIVGNALVMTVPSRAVRSALKPRENMMAQKVKVCLTVSWEVFE